MKLISSKQFGILASLVLAAASPALVQGQLTVYNFNSTSTPLVASTVAPGVTAGTMVLNPPWNWFWTTPAGTLQLNAGVGVNNAAESIAYYNPGQSPTVGMDASFTLSSATPMNLSSLTLDGGYGNFANPAGYALESSVDGFSSIISTANFSQNVPAFSTYSVNLSGAAFQNITSITFKIFGYNADYGYEQFDNVTVNGTLGAVPEPGSLALAAMGIAGLMALRRRN
jgi:hypothetical protein